MDKVNVGIIGTGGIANQHIKHLLEIDGVAVTALCDVSEANLKKAADAYKVERTFSDYKKMLKLDDVDAVCVCTPNIFHFKPTVDALQAGKHVMVEKPMAMNAREAQKMCDVAKEAGKVLSVGFQLRYSPAAQMIKRAVDGGQLGNVLYARSQALRRRGIPSWGVFGRKDLQGGGPMIDIGVHILEVTHYLMGRPKPVAASGATYTYLGNKKPEVVGRTWDYQTYTVEDLAVGIIRFESGATLSIESSFAAHIENNVFDFQLMGDKGGATFSPPKIFTDAHGTMLNITPGFEEKNEQWPAKMNDWIDSIRTGKTPTASGEDGLVVQKMLDGIYRSAEAGKEVAIK